MMSKSTRRVLLIGVGFAVLAGCTPSYQVPRGGQSFPLVNPTFMALPVQPMFCNTDKVGYCPGSAKPAAQ